MADTIGHKGILWEAVTKERWNNWEGGTIGGITYPPCQRMGNVIRIPWQVGDGIDPMEPLLLYRYVCREGCSYLELCLNQDGNPILNR